MTSNDAIVSSSSMGTFLIELENMVEFLVLLFSSLTSFKNVSYSFVKIVQQGATKNSTTFFNYIRNVPIEDDEIMVSFDVTSLYTNIPIIDTLNIIKDYVKMMINLLEKRLQLKTSFFI